jgi:hypothetical protein
LPKLLVDDRLRVELAIDGDHPAAPGPQLFQTNITTTKPPTSTKPVVMTLLTFMRCRPYGEARRSRKLPRCK